MLIGLHGKKQSGKDTTAQFILDWAEQKGRAAQRDAFADRLKWSAYRCFKPDATLEEALEWADLMKIDDHWVMSGVGEVNDFLYNACIEGRRFFQHYGTEAHRQIFGDDFWIDCVLPPVSTGLFIPGHEKNWGPNLDHILVITDVRFPNEAQRISALGGEIWQILRAGDTDLDPHASEKPLDPELIDHVVMNDRDLNHLQNLALSRVERLIYSPDNSWLHRDAVRRTLPCEEIKGRNFKD